MKMYGALFLIVFFVHERMFGITIHRAIATKNKASICFWLGEGWWGLLKKMVGAQHAALNPPDGTAIVPLVIAAMQSDDDPEMVEFFLGKGADVHRCDKHGLSALHAAVIKNNRNIIRALLQNGADINRADAQGYTPLLTAVVYNASLETMQLLLKRGAHPLAVTHRGHTLSRLIQEANQENRQAYADLVNPYIEAAVALQVAYVCYVVQASSMFVAGIDKRDHYC